MQTNGRIIEKVDKKGQKRYGVSYVDKRGKVKSFMFPLGTTKKQAIIKLVKLVDE